MKQAAINECWKNLNKSIAPANGITRITQCRDNESRSFKTDGLFAVVGLNGSGKSSFFDFLTNLSYDRLQFCSHEIELHGEKIINIPGDVLKAELVDPSTELRESNRKILLLKSTWGQQDYLSLKPEEVSMLNFVLGTSYDQVMLEEIEVADSEFCPHFKATKKNTEFGHDSLSLGEQLVFYIFWCLTKKFKSPGIFLIEEPESGLSPITQRRMIDMLAYISQKKSKQIFISTHSPFIVSCLGPERVLLMKKSNRAEWVNANQSNYLEELGMDLGCKGIIFLEDNKAKVIADQLLSLYGSDLVKTHDLVFLGGESEVYEVVSRINLPDRKFRIIGLLDADQKNIPKYSPHHGKFYFLPGTLPPEKEVLNYIVNCTDKYAAALAVSFSKLEDSIRRCQGQDHHDFFENLSLELYGEIRQNVYQEAVRIWLTNYHDRSELHALIKSLDEHIPQENIDEVDRTYPPQ